jgi:hypothetical protein
MHLLIVELRKMRNCPICNKPVVVPDNYENAEITHIECAESLMKDIRKEREEVNAAERKIWHQLVKK